MPNYLKVAGVLIFLLTGCISAQKRPIQPIKQEIIKPAIQPAAPISAPVKKTVVKPAVAKPQAQSKVLLLWAIILGLIMVVVYNLRPASVQKGKKTSKK